MQTVITAPFYCDYGSNITIGNNFYTNHNCTILDGAKVTFSDNVFIAPNVVFSTAGHAIDAGQRAKGLEIALPITVGDNVWIGANISVLPGVSIGSNTIIGAGSVVNKDIPDGVIAAGVPCRVIRRITENDRQKYPEYYRNIANFLVYGIGNIKNQEKEEGNMKCTVFYESWQLECCFSVGRTIL